MMAKPSFWDEAWRRSSKTIAPARHPPISPRVHDAIDIAPMTAHIPPPRSSAIAKFELNIQMIRCARQGDSEELMHLLALGAEPKFHDFKALCAASAQGHLECVKLLIPASPKNSNSTALVYAASKGRADCVALLIPVLDPAANNFAALLSAARCGHAECTSLLLPISGDKAQRSAALVLAAWHGHADCVMILMPVSDIAHDKWGALRLAAQHGHAECVRLLMRAPHPMSTLENILSTALGGGHAGIVAALFDGEPRLLAGRDLSRCRRVAQMEGYADLAALLSSIDDRRALSEAAPPSDSSPSPRLRI